MKPKVYKSLKPRNFGIEEKNPELLAHDVSKRKGSGDAQAAAACVLHSSTAALPHCSPIWSALKLLCAPVCCCGTSTACFSRCWVSWHRARKPSFASKAWRKQDSDAVSPFGLHAHGPTAMCWKFTWHLWQNVWIQQKSIFYWNGVLPENFRPVLHWLL